jgi:hypothetical protein
MHYKVVTDKSMEGFVARLIDENKKVFFVSNFHCSPELAKKEVWDYIKNNKSVDWGIEKNKTLLERAYEILHERAEEKERQYGDFTESINKTADIASLMSNKKFTTDDVYNILIAMKLARESYAHKEDNILDAVVYLAQKNIHR